jgi:ATP-dependent helicase HrpA
VRRETLLAKDLGGEVGEQFPDHLQWQDMSFKLSYQFEPGKVADGVSVTVPVGLLNRTPRFLFDWLVPGLLREKCIAMVRALPKAKRRQLVPVPDFVDKALSVLSPADVDLGRALAAQLSKAGHLSITPDDWNDTVLDDYYRMNVKVVDAAGKLLEQGRDLKHLIGMFRSDTGHSVSSAKSDSPARTGITRWDFDELPQQWKFRQAGIDIVAYPALVDKGQSVDIELFDYPEQAKIQHRSGVLRLAQLHNATSVKYLTRQLLKGNKYTLVIAAAQLDRTKLLVDLSNAAFVWAMKLDAELPWTQNAFTEMVNLGKGEVVTCANELESTLFNALSALAELRKELVGADSAKYRGTFVDVNDQLAKLLYPGFIQNTPQDWFAQYPRYFKALLNRVQRLGGQPAKDQKNTEMLDPVAARLWQAQHSRPELLAVCADALRYRWMLEEFRVSLFAQSLGTRQAISAKRLDEQWEKVAQWISSNPH